MKKICFYCGQQYKKSKTRCLACGAVKLKLLNVKGKSDKKEKQSDEFTPKIEQNAVTGRYRILLKPESKNDLAYYLGEFDTLSCTYAEWRFLWLARLALSRFMRRVRETQGWQ